MKYTRTIDEITETFEGESVEEIRDLLILADVHMSEMCDECEEGIDDGEIEPEEKPEEIKVGDWVEIKYFSIPFFEGKEAQVVAFDNLGNLAYVRISGMSSQLPILLSDLKKIENKDIKPGDIVRIKSLTHPFDGYKGIVVTTWEESNAASVLIEPIGLINVPQSELEKSGF